MIDIFVLLELFFLSSSLGLSEITNSRDTKCVIENYVKLEGSYTHRTLLVLKNSSKVKKYLLQLHNLLKFNYIYKTMAEILIKYIPITISSLAIILSIISIYKSSKARKKIKDALHTIHFTNEEFKILQTRQYFEDTMISIRNSLPYDVNEPTWMPNEPQKKIVKKYWYFVKEEYEICLEGGEKLNRLWLDVYTPRIKHAINMPGFISVLKELINQGNSALISEPFFTELNKIYIEEKGSELAHENSTN